MNKFAYYNYEVKKPLYETKEGVVVGIYSKRVENAIKNRQFLQIKSKGLTGVFSPKWVRKHCKKFKKVYLRPQEPMVEYELFIPKPKPKTEEDKLREFSAQCLK